MNENDAAPNASQPPSHDSREKDQRLRLFIECVQDSAVFTLDAQGRILDWNTGAERLFGHTEAEIVGQPISTIFPTDEQARVEAEMKTAATEGRAVSEGWRIHKDGSRFWGSGMLTALRDEQGTLHGFGKVVRNLTERKRAEESLREIESRLHLLMECVRDFAIFTLDPVGRVLDWNTGAQHILGYDPGEIIGKPFGVFFASNEKHMANKELKEASDTGRATDDCWHVRKDGTHFFANGITTALRQPDGTLRGFVKVLRDNTERKHMEEELRRRTDALNDAGRRKDEFLAMLAHELRNPLAPLFNALQLLVRFEPLNPIQQQAHGMIDRQLRQLAHLVDDLLDVSRITRGKISLTKQQLKLDDIVQHAIETSRPTIEGRKHALTVTLPNEPLSVEADPTRLEQIFANLLNNAAKFTPPEGQIALTVTREGMQAVVTVQDNGVGIAPEMLPRIFDLFTQAERTLDRSQGGLGIGLTLVKRLTELQDGQVEAHSAGLGKGSDFTVRLPLLLTTPEPVTAPPVTPSQGALRPLRVLVVDDNDDACESLALLLRMSGYEVQIAKDGQSALEVTGRFDPHVAILDIGLPALDGYQVAKRLREQPSTKDIMLIALTGYGQEADKQQGKEAGFNYHLVKPVDPDKLQQILTTLAYQHGQT